MRIAPNEIHLSDPENYDKIYSVASKFYKDPAFYNALGVDVMFTAISNDLHRRHRAPLNHFFSRRAVFDLEDIVQEKVRKLCARIQASLRAGKPVDLRASTRAVSIDVLSEYAFDDCWNHLDSEDYAAWFSEAVRDTGVMWWTFQQFPVMLGPMQMMPESWARKMSPAMNGWMDCVVRAREYVVRVNDQFKSGSKPTRRTIFHELIDPPPSTNEEGEEEEKYPPPSFDRLYGEALSFCTAAADTTGNAMEMAAYHVITNPDIYAKLHRELRDAFPDPSRDLDYATLEKLPYLTGVVKEGQRLSYGVLSRLARATPEGGATFNGYYVPAGVRFPSPTLSPLNLLTNTQKTTVSMSSYTMHNNPTVFPSPTTFSPERWTEGDVRSREKCLVPFSRGSRACIGQNLAMCELYVTLGMLFHRFDNLEAFDIGPEDMEYVDYFTAFHPKGSRAFKVVGNGKGGK